MTVMGEQLKPTRTLRSWRTMPKSPRMAPTLESDACWTLLQHWMGPVLQELPTVVVGPGAVTVTVVVTGWPPGMAEARMAEERATTEVVNFIVRGREASEMS
jgi:hypothetical protein